MTQNAVETLSIDPEIAPTFTSHLTPENEYNLSSFFGSLLRDMAESKAGNFSNKDAWFVDHYHRSGADKYNEWRFTAQVASMETPKGETLRELLEAAENDVYGQLYDILADLWLMTGNNPEEMPEIEETKQVQNPETGEYEPSPLLSLAEYTVWHKFVWTTYFGAKVEEFAKDMLCHEYDTEEAYLISDQIEEKLDIDCAESAGIDLLIPEVGTFQVKTGKGGKLKCKADYVVRYVEPQEEDGLTECQLRITEN